MLNRLHSSASIRVYQHTAKVIENSHDVRAGVGLACVAPLQGLGAAPFIRPCRRLFVRGLA